MKRPLVFLAGAVLLGLVSLGQSAPAPAAQQWTKLKTEPYRGKQDDIFFIDAEVGWYVNGSGKIYKTTDGGRTWAKKLDQPGTYFRCIGFVDARRGFAGNIGPDYFPGVTDATPLYETRDGGETWKPVSNIQGPAVKGVCAIFVAKGRIFAAGRVGGPAFLLRSDDGGESWHSTDMSRHCGMILDIEFTDAKTGIISAASSADVTSSNALILRTTDGGRTWKKVFQSTRPFETTWKSSFPTKKVGYVTIQSYNPDKTASRRFVAKTTNGGKSWSEVPLVDDFGTREFGIAFLDAKRGWVGATNGGFETRDGGRTWTPVAMGKVVNKIRVVNTAGGFVGYAIGVDVYKWEGRVGMGVR